ncbi:PEP-CTERM protein-sorting domain-containing protein [Arsukibacterium tuosuense]|uniref:PEP-CTERM protein-sorting domain-containing protein n=1 Tax=Arsukibacterium tuosuense TaxID=1323745 RepID=A0A285IX49_9GAMM|nr:PEP-CTERM sorting domain-containing protein [Arsukibacterium tuosuense]SNY51666.1 PEP-CTERM protein-sorting domain-containing protein [Arsukibacterium tuosuense]
MKKLTSLLGASVFALSAFAASAAPVNINGVTWDPSSPLSFAADTDFFTQSIINNPGDTLSGWGKIGSVNANSGFCSGCELTFEFGGFNASSVSPGVISNTNPDSLFSSTGWVINIDFQFAGGFANFWVDNTPDFDTSFASSTNGDLWLSMTPNTGFGPSLTANAWIAYDPDTGTILFDEIINGTGLAFLDATGGAAFGNFDLDSQLFGADARVTSRFGVRATPENLTMNAVTVPEPASLAILGLGLLGMGALSRRRKA